MHTFRLGARLVNGFSPLLLIDRLMHFCNLLSVFIICFCLIFSLAVLSLCLSKPHLTNLHLQRSLSRALPLPHFSLSPRFHCAAFPLAAFRFVWFCFCLIFTYIFFLFFALFFFLLFLRKSFQLVNRVDFKKSVPSILVLIHFLSFMNACCQLLRYMFPCVCVSWSVCVCRLELKLLLYF